MITLTLCLDVPELYHEFTTTIELDDIKDLDRCQEKVLSAIVKLRRGAKQAIERAY